ncbi:aminotransferase class I/II-fold pyridoxal phosphate-dependent enzyme [Nocardia sp. NPDC020380]|uniref:aminotransferase class I/II-fold pyridoxal phosphate-dependent enzyme n=1 Tax=Nocardia sp. NPDC020380 TaxID=3364309 RepID=UPI0037989A56
MELELNALSESVLRRRHSLKWSRARADRIPMDVAEADFAIAEPIRMVLDSAVASSDLGYPDFDSPRGGPALLANVFATRLSTRYGVAVDPARVEICAQIMQALSCVLLAFSEPGDYVLTHRPTYPPILDIIVALGRRPVLIDALSAGDRTMSVLDRPDLPFPIRVVVLCQPHNPTGRIFDAAELESIAELAERHDAVIFADEIHQDLVYDVPHRSIAAIMQARARTILFTSAGKSFNIAGLRCAVGHFGSDLLQARFQALPWHLRSGASVLGIEATIAAWSRCDSWLDQFRDLLHRNRDLIVGTLNDCPESGLSVVTPESTYFAWINGGDTTGRRRVIDQATCATQPGSLFGEVFSGHFRLNFATSTERVLFALCELVSLSTAPATFK